MEAEVISNDSEVADWTTLWHRYLRSFESISPPSIDDARRLGCRSRRRMLSRGEVIALPDETDRALYLIEYGWMWITRTMDDGRSLAVEIFGPGEMVGEWVVVTGRPFSEAVECVQEANLIQVPASEFYDLSERYPSLLRHIGQRVGARMERIEERLSSFLFTTVVVRVARLLIELNSRYGERSRLPCTLTHQEIGQLIGSNREATTRAIGSLLDRRVIRYEGRHIRLLRPDLLCAAAECDPDHCLEMCRRIPAF